MAPGAAIPYRTDSAISGGTYAMAMLVTLALMGLLLIALWLIRRRGWLALLGKPRATVAVSAIELRASRRLSVASTVHVLSYEGRTYLVVESSRGAQAAITPMTELPADADSEVQS